MSLAPEQFRVRSAGPGLPCGVAKALERLSEPDRKVLAQALAAPVTEVGHKRIHEVLMDAEKVYVSPQTIGHHRRGECRCAS